MFQRISGHRPRYADVAATVALILAMGGTAYAATVLPAKSVGTKQLKPSAVTTAKLHNGAVTTAKLGVQSVTSVQIAPNSVSGSQVVPHSLTLSDLHGADIAGPIHFTLAAHTCTDMSIGAAGVAVGQVAVMNWEGDVAIPRTIVTGPMKVASANRVTGELCNVGSANVSESGIDVRIITFS